MTYEWQVTLRGLRCRMAGPAMLVVAPKARSSRWGWSMVPPVEAEARSGERASLSAAQEAAEMAYRAWRNV